MYDMPAEHMRALLGINPDVVPASLQFPRLPPGTMHPLTSRFAIPSKRTKHDAASMMPDLEVFQEAHQRHAAALLGSSFPEIVPPGHPLYDRQYSAGILKSENDRLLKENIELKKRLDGAESG